MRLSAFVAICSLALGSACGPDFTSIAQIVPAFTDGAILDRRATPRPDAGATDAVPSRLNDGEAPTPVVQALPFAPHKCPNPGTTIGVEAQHAHDRLNTLRTGVGLPCVAYQSAIAAAAKKHCDYYSQNETKTECVLNPHREVAGCTGFTGERFTDRIKKAGYNGEGIYEVMAYVGDGAWAVDLWLNSVWHRVPLLSHEVAAFGYGTTGLCDTIDFSRLSTTDKNTTVLYPAPNQTDVPTEFDGNESPLPPEPPRGWPSGYPVSLHAPGVTITEHSIVVDGTQQNLAHHFVRPGDPVAADLLQDEFFLYTHEPLRGMTRYRVRLVGSRGGKPVTFDWSFVTRPSGR
jgi:uncharacterized protein YkwD